jgi:hypothetical protein
VPGPPLVSVNISTCSGRAVNHARSSRARDTAAACTLSVNTDRLPPSEGLVIRGPRSRDIPSRQMPSMAAPELSLADVGGVHAGGSLASNWATISSGDRS